MREVLAGGIADRAAHALYSDALLLADETRAYFEGEGRAERDRLEPFGRVTFACEALKATTRLLQVLAWTTACRQAGAGEATLGDASASEPETLGLLPTPARRLILAGLDLHARAGRLARGVDGDVASASPARALLQRLERSL